MKPKLPAGTRAEQIEFARHLRAEQLMAQPHVRLVRRLRRMIVIGLCVIVVATAIWAGVLAAGAASGNKATGLIYFLLAVQSVLFTVLAYAVGALTGRNTVLDERERAVRDRANALAYRILAVTIGGLSFIALTANALFGWRPSLSPSVGLIPLLVPLIWFVAVLPMAVLAWTLPDPEPDAAGELSARSGT